MKKIKDIILFIIGFIAVTILLSILLKPKNNTEESGMDYPSSKVIFTLDEDTIDVFYIGSSLVYSSISPVKIYESTGITGYDLSYPSQTIFDSLYFLRASLKTQTPKLVVLESDTLFTSYSMMSALKSELENNVPLIKYHNRWKNLTLRDLYPKVEYTNMNNLMGFRYQNTKKDIEGENDPTAITIGKVANIYTDLIKKECDRVGAKLIIMSMPSSNYSKERIDATASFANSKNIEYINLNDKVEIDWTSETIDNGMHLNYKGAYKVSNYIAKYLVSTTLFENHKNDTRYAYWNEVLDSYNKEYND